MKQFKSWSPIEQICLFMAIIFFTVVITMNLKPRDHRKEPIVHRLLYQDHEIPWSEIKDKLRRKYIQTTNEKWVYCINVYDDGRFSYSDDEGTFGYDLVANIIAVSDIPVAHN